MLLGDKIETVEDLQKVLAQVLAPDCVPVKVSADGFNEFSIELVLSDGRALIRPGRRTVR